MKSAPTYDRLLLPVKDLQSAGVVSSSRTTGNCAILLGLYNVRLDSRI